MTQLNASGTAAVYSTYLGGTGGDAANAIALDASGAAYVAGMTASSDFPVTPGAFQLTGGGTSVSAFAAKIAPQGSSLGYSTYLGGVGQVTANGIAVDSAANAYLTGFANDASFPVASPTQETSGGFYDAFLTQLNSGGTAVTFSTYLGGSGNDTGQGVAVDEAGNAYIAGGTFSVDFPTQSAFQPLYGGGSFDAFAAKFSALKLSGLALSEPGFTFADQGVSTTSPPQTETLTNTSGAALELSSISASGDFVQTNHCGTTLAPGASCTVQLEFAPTATGNRTGTLAISDDAPDSPQTAALRGNAVVAFLLSATPSDTTVLAGTDSASFVVTAASPFSFEGGVNLTCDVGAPLQCAFNPAIIIPGGQSTLTVAKLSQSAASSVAFNVEGVSENQVAKLPLTVLISDFTLNAPSPSAAVSAGKAATYQLTLQSINGFRQPVEIECSGAPPQAACSVAPASLTPGSPSAANLTVTVTTTAGAFERLRIQGPRPLVPAPGWGWYGLNLLALLSMAVASRSQRKLSRRLIPWCAIGMLLWTACGGGGGGGGGNFEMHSGTPPGSYELKVSGTSGQLTRGVTLTLQVN